MGKFRGFVGLIAVCTAATSWAQAPQPGWRATLSRLSHNTGGTVTVVDNDTLRVDNFSYDGGGLDVLFYLGTAETRAAFTAGIPIGNQLLGQVYNGTQPPLFIDLPAGETIANWRAISLWCVDVYVSFGNGTFLPPPIPGDYSQNGAVDAADYTYYRDRLGATTALPNDSTAGVATDDLTRWRNNFGQTSSAAVAASAPVPEPAGVVTIAIVLGAWGASRNRRRSPS